MKRISVNRKGVCLTAYIEDEVTKEEVIEDYMPRSPVTLTDYGVIVNRQRVTEGIQRKWGNVARGEKSLDTLLKHRVLRKQPTGRIHKDYFQYLFIVRTILDHAAEIAESENPPHSLGIISSRIYANAVMEVEQKLKRTKSIPTENDFYQSYRALLEGNETGIAMWFIQTLGEGEESQAKLRILDDIREGKINKRFVIPSFIDKNLPD
jgi:hypothetical protein